MAGGIPICTNGLDTTGTEAEVRVCGLETDARERLDTEDFSIDCPVVGEADEDCGRGGGTTFDAVCWGRGGGGSGVDGFPPTLLIVTIGSGGDLAVLGAGESSTMTSG